MLQVLLATNATITARTIRTDRIAQKRAAVKMAQPATRQMVIAFVPMVGREQPARIESAQKISMANTAI